MSEYYPPYIDLDRAYPRPADGAPGHVGWWHQLAYNLDEMHNAINIGGRDVGIGWIQDAEYLFGTPAWVNVANASGSEAGHIRVGQTCWVWARSESCDLTTEQAGYTLPIPAADSVLPMATVIGFIDNGTDHRSITGRIVDGALRFWFSPGTGAFNSALNSSSYPTLLPGVTTGFTMSIAGSYRCQPAPAGRLTDRTSRVTRQTQT